MKSRPHVFSILNLEPDQMTTLNKIHEKYGSRRQITKLGEESAELAAAILKYLNESTPETWDKIVEELGDTFLMIVQFVAHYLTKADEEKIQELIEFKLNRQVERMNGGN